MYLSVSFKRPAPSHAPRERVSWNTLGAEMKPTTVRHAPRERVSWNEPITLDVWHCKRHAPRERVSWNDRDKKPCDIGYVTLHVSVWVEIYSDDFVFWLCLVTLHVSVWVEIEDIVLVKIATQSRSTWACELKFKSFTWVFVNGWSRSTWACELKLNVNHLLHFNHGHAPRERVSWNVRSFNGYTHSI